MLLMFGMPYIRLVDLSLNVCVCDGNDPIEGEQGVVCNLHLQSSLTPCDYTLPSLRICSRCVHYFLHISNTVTLYELFYPDFDKNPGLKITVFVISCSSFLSSKDGVEVFIVCFVAKNLSSNCTFRAGP